MAETSLTLAHQAVAFVPSPSHNIFHQKYRLLLLGRVAAFCHKNGEYMLSQFRLLPDKIDKCDLGAVAPWPCNCLLYSFLSSPLQ